MLKMNGMLKILKIPKSGKNVECKDITPFVT